DTLKRIGETIEVEAPDNILRELKEEKRFLLWSDKAVAIVRHSGDVLDVDYVAGNNIWEWKDAMDKAVEQIARAFGCRKVVAIGRKEWGRIWPSYRNTGKIIFVKDLDNE